MKVSREKYAAIKRMTGSMDKVAAKFGVSCTTVRRIRGSLNYEAYKGSMAKPKKGSLTNATASGKKKAGSSSSTSKSKTSGKPKSNLNNDNKNSKKGEWEESPNLSIPVNTKFGAVVAPTIKKIEPSDDIKSLKWDLEKRESSLEERHDALIKDYVHKSEELDNSQKKFKIAIAIVVALTIALMIAIIL